MIKTFIELFWPQIVLLANILPREEASDNIFLNYYFQAYQKDKTLELHAAIKAVDECSKCRVNKKFVKSPALYNRGLLRL